jgi:transcriptional regulator with XRE-family HTH domain
MNSPASATSSTLGAVIRDRRRQFGWSQEALAARVVANGDTAFRQTDVSRLERGKVSLPRRERLGHIAAALGFSLGELLMRSGWIDDEIVPGSRPQSAPPAPLEPFAASWTWPAVARHPETEVARVADRSPLGELIARSEKIRRDSREVLQQCEATRARYDEVSWMRGSQTPKRRVNRP